MVLKEERTAARRHVAENIISMRLKIDPRIAAQYLPAPFEPNREGELTVMLADYYGHDEDMVDKAEAAAKFVYPYYTTMQEGLISIPCKFEGKPGNYLARIWQDRDWAVQRGPMLGYNTELAEVHINRFPGRLRKLYAPHVGSKIKGVVRQNGDNLISGWIELTEEVSYPEEEYMVCYGRRQIEDMLDPEGEKLIDDILIEYHDSEIKGQVFKGVGHLRLGGFMKDWDYEIIDAYYFEIGFSTSGWRVLKDLKQQRG